MSNLRLINDTTITSGVSSVNIENVFSADFDIYKIVANGISTVGTTQTDPNFRFINSSGTIVTASNYDYGQLYLRSYASDTEIRSSSDTDIRLVVGDEDSFGGTAIIYVFNPTNISSYTFVLHQGSLAIDLNNNNTVSFASNKGIGLLHEFTSITGFHLKNNNASASVDYTATTYGLRVDS